MLQDSASETLQFFAFSIKLTRAGQLGCANATAATPSPSNASTLSVVTQGAVGESLLLHDFSVGYFSPYSSFLITYKLFRTSL
jgi:hypothetical protein